MAVTLLNFFPTPCYFGAREFLNIVWHIWYPKLLLLYRFWRAELQILFTFCENYLLLSQISVKSRTAKTIE